MAVISFDLQAVLPIPHAGDAEIYYMRKLNAYNFTIYETASRNGYCFIWDETEGNRGANEVATCLLQYIKALPSTVTEVCTYSDTCGGQNRNQFICAAMLHATQVTNVNVIDLKYMESGHSYLEADAMHSTIEKAKRHQKIYTTRELELVIAGARRNPSPFVVTRLTHEDFFDLKQLGRQIICNRTQNTAGDKVNWLKIKHLRFDKTMPHTVQYKYALSADDFMELDILGRTRRRGKRSQLPRSLQPLYTSRLPVSAAKKKDLLKLLHDHVIPPEYSDWYRSLPVSDAVNDRLPAPSADEPEPDELDE